MSTSINGVVTSQGTNILSSTFREYVRYAYLICNDGPQYILTFDENTTLDDLKAQGWYLWKHKINAAFFDKDGILTYVIQLNYDEIPEEEDKNWIYGLVFVYKDPATDEEKIVALSKVPVTQKLLGQTYQFIAKLPISDSPSQVIFGSVVFHSGLDPESVYTKTQVDELFATKKQLQEAMWFSWILG